MRLWLSLRFLFAPIFCALGQFRLGVETGNCVIFRISVFVSCLVECSHRDPKYSMFWHLQGYSMQKTRHVHPIKIPILPQPLKTMRLCQSPSNTIFDKAPSTHHRQSRRHLSSLETIVELALWWSSLLWLLSKAESTVYALVIGVKT